MDDCEENGHGEPLVGTAQNDTIINMGEKDPKQEQHQKKKHSAKIVRVLQDYCKLVKARPCFMLLPPLIVFCLLCSLSTVGVVLGADKYEKELRGRAASAATDWAASFRLSAEKMFTPLVALAIYHELNPQLETVKATFPTMAQQLLKSVNKDGLVVQELQISPMGVITVIAPKNNDTDTRLGINIFKQPALRGGAVNTIKQRALVMNGPLKLVQGNYGTIARIPIFIQDSNMTETFGTNMTLPYDCTDLCYNKATNEKFWGFVTAIGPLDDLRAGNDSRLALLKQYGYKWLMTRPYTSTERGDPMLYRPEWTDQHDDYVFANSSTWPEQQDAIASEIKLANAVWKVYLEPEQGWRPTWERGLIGAVIVGNLVLAVLVAIIMALWAQQARLLGDVLESNARLEKTTAELQEEKLRLDALLVRQYNLLQVLGGPKGKGQGQKKRDHDLPNGVIKETGSPDSSQGSKEGGLTLERIETMRRQLAVNSNTSAQDLESIQCQEMLGEGTFGKVYRGLWRGTVVAVKTMLLPANMSGAEKREKMAVMEAAISSSLSHPNIVQTYTYAIKPMRETSEPLSNPSNPTDEFSGSGARTDGPGGKAVSSMATSAYKTTDSSSAASIHSYEVRLVLEYCDMGCLRDALDDGVFRLPGAPSGVNYLAVLDTAADVAKAMLHLHSLDVLHSDLKARNVMMSTGKADGRGMVGKVGDFGLSLKMDHMETHISQIYQGTITHMAPEVMMQGRVSKASDVYAFGITMWELYSGGRPFEGIPRAWLGHQITREQLRPRFPEGAPRRYRELAERCWDHNYEKRPTFVEILTELMALRAEDSRQTPALHITPRVRRAPKGPSTSGAVAGSAAVGNTSLCYTAGLSSQQQQQEWDGEPTQPSFYIDNSCGLGDPDIIVMNSLSGSDWNVEDLGGSSVGSGSGGGMPMVQRMRPSVMPPIAEDVDDSQQQQQQEEQQQQEGCTPKAGGKDHPPAA